VPDDGVIPVMMALHEQLVHGTVGTALATAQARVLPDPSSFGDLAAATRRALSVAAGAFVCLGAG